jgi:hypothetical protein
MTAPLSPLKAKRLRVPGQSLDEEIDYWRCERVFDYLFASHQKPRSVHWNWPKKISRPQIQNLFRLNFVEQKSNAIFLSGIGLGKTICASRELAVELLPKVRVSRQVLGPFLPQEL